MVSNQRARARLSMPNTDGTGPGSQVSGAALLLTLRQQTRLTQGELADLAGISRSMVAQLEIGERRPSRKLLARLAEAMSLPNEELDRMLVAYGFTPGGETPDQIAAVLRADKHLTPEQ